MQLDWSYAIKVIPTILEGLKYTILISVLGIFIGFIIGSIFGFLRQCNNKILNKIAYIYIWIIRGTPLMVQALYFYFAIPALLGINLDRVVAGVCVIALNSGAYIAEIVRGALQSVDPGQKEAGVSLGLSNTQTLFHIIIPPAFSSMLPSLGNQFIIALKDTALLTVIGVGELTHQASMIASTSFKTVETYTTLAVMYLILTTLLSFLLKFTEKKVR